jgi:hypothetical protein
MPSEICVDGERTPQDENNKKESSSSSNIVEVEQLRKIVEQQGQLMSQMLKEQNRLNRMIQQVLTNKKTT